MELAEHAAAAKQAWWQQTHRLWGRGWLESHPGFQVSCSELPAANLNGASVHDDFDPEELITALERLGAEGFPFSLECRPGVRGPVAAVAAQLGLQPQPGAPLMVSTHPPAFPATPGLEIRRLAPAESDRHAHVLADAFGTPLDLALELTPPRILEPDNVWALVGDCDGEPVTTALLDLQGEIANLHNVGTREPYRGRGFGAAVSAAAARLAFSAGARGIALMSTPMGYRIYASLGFRTLEHWSAWNSPGPL